MEEIKQEEDSRTEEDCIKKGNIDIKNEKRECNNDENIIKEGYIYNLLDRLNNLKKLKVNVTEDDINLNNEIREDKGIHNKIEKSENVSIGMMENADLNNEIRKNKNINIETEKNENLNEIRKNENIISNEVQNNENLYEIRENVNLSNEIEGNENICNEVRKNRNLHELEKIERLFKEIRKHENLYNEEVNEILLYNDLFNYLVEKIEYIDIENKEIKKYLKEEIVKLKENSNLLFDFLKKSKNEKNNILLNMNDSMLNELKNSFYEIFGKKLKGECNIEYEENIMGNKNVSRIFSILCKKQVINVLEEVLENVYADENLDESKIKRLSNLNNFMYLLNTANSKNNITESEGTKNSASVKRETEEISNDHHEISNKTNFSSLSNSSNKTNKINKLNLNKKTSNYFRKDNNETQISLSTCLTETSFIEKKIKEKNSKKKILYENNNILPNDKNSKKMFYENNNSLTNEYFSDMMVYISWVPKSARCQYPLELPKNSAERNKLAEYIEAKEQMLYILKLMGYEEIDNIYFHPPKGSHIKIKFKTLACMNKFLKAYKNTPDKWKEDMFNFFNIPLRSSISVRDLRIERAVPRSSAAEFKKIKKINKNYHDLFLFKENYNLCDENIENMEKINFHYNNFNKNIIGQNKNDSNNNKKINESKKNLQKTKSNNTSDNNSANIGSNMNKNMDDLDNNMVINNDNINSSSLGINSSLNFPGNSNASVISSNNILNKNNNNLNNNYNNSKNNLNNMKSNKVFLTNKANNNINNNNNINSDNINSINSNNIHNISINNGSVNNKNVNGKLNYNATNNINNNINHNNTMFASRNSSRNIYNIKNRNLHRNGSSISNSNFLNSVNKDMMNSFSFKKQTHYASFSNNSNNHMNSLNQHVFVLNNNSNNGTQDNISNSNQFNNNSDSNNKKEKSVLRNFKDCYTNNYSENKDSAHVNYNQGNNIMKQNNYNNFNGELVNDKYIQNEEIKEDLKNLINIDFINDIDMDCEEKNQINESTSRNVNHLQQQSYSKGFGTINNCINENLLNNKTKEYEKYDKLSFNNINGQNYIMNQEHSNDEIHFNENDFSYSNTNVNNNQDITENFNYFAEEKSNLYDKKNMFNYYNNTMPQVNNNIHMNINHNGTLNLKSLNNSSLNINSSINDDFNSVDHNDNNSNLYRNTLNTKMYIDELSLNNAFNKYEDEYCEIKKKEEKMRDFEIKMNEEENKNFLNYSFHSSHVENDQNYSDNYVNFF
ncbi:asparagine-rich protein, putative [Plasmodium relictum]|uniref:Asparagine-rich protein, putative n=1 Tax=Plasmodium relictum TaxID=85471 RepID=A0A1J1HB70_PLARL|nr:asparagine-rich protein, putative [Plasmodium relictum]CRH02745.1 asparagine-rich protein, putative [Plasmodium relictum]